MAVSRNGNVIYADSTGTITGKFSVIGIVVTSTGGAAHLKLEDSGNDKINVRIDATDKTEHVRLENTPIRFDTNIDVTALTNAEATIIIKPLGG